MAFNLDFSKSREALGRVTQFLQYDAMQRRAAERQQKQALLENALASDLSTQKYGQDLQLEAFRSANNRTEETNKAILGVLAMPELDAAVSTLNLARAGKLGKEHEPLIQHAKEILENGYKDIGDAAYAVQTGAAGPEHLAQIVKYYGTKGIEYSKELGISLRALEQNKIDKEMNRIRAAQELNTAADRIGKLTDIQKAQIKSIEDAQSHIIGQGIVPLDATSAMNIDLYGKAVGRAYDTYNTDTAGQYKQGLEEIKQQVINGQLMNSMQQSFIKRTYNAFQTRNPVAGELGKPGTAASPKTGISGKEGDESKARETEVDILSNCDYLLRKMFPGRDPNVQPWTNEEINNPLPGKAKSVRQVVEEYLGVAKDVEDTKHSMTKSTKTTKVSKGLREM